MMTKQKILRGIEDHLVNIYCCKVDVELDDQIPQEIKQDAVIDLTVKYANLLDIRSKLKELLAG